jgi:cellulose synthase/poly-beta-1,6-N-acetylglucosamine synthase-like glycosyltransferase
MNKLCVVIPAKNEARVIARSIRSILAAGIAARDIYIIDDGSKDDTVKRAERFGVRVMRNELSAGKALSIRKAVAQFDLASQYRLISVVDADTLVDRFYFDYLQVAFVANPKAVLVCGRVDSIPCNWATAGRAFDYLFSQSIHKKGQSKMRVVLVAPGCASTWKADVFAQLDCDPLMLTEDMDMTVQIHRRKLGEIIYEPAAIVYTQDPNTLRGYIRQSYRWYFGLWQVLQKHSLPFRFKRLDFEVGLLVLEGLIFSLGLVLSPIVLLLSPKTGLSVAVGDQLLMAVFALYFAVSGKRKDIALYFPAFIVLRYTTALVFGWTFVRAVICRMARPEWFTPARY